MLWYINLVVTVMTSRLESLAVELLSLNLSALEFMELILEFAVSTIGLFLVSSQESQTNLFLLETGELKCSSASQVAFSVIAAFLAFLVI